MTAMATRRAVPVAALVVAALSACTSDSQVRPPPLASTTSPSSNPSPTPTAGSAFPTASSAVAASCSPQPFAANTSPDTQTAVGGVLGMKAITAGRHHCYDRVVFTLGGSATALPGWRVEYVAHPTSDGSGNPVAVAGASFLRVVIKAVGVPSDTGVPDPSPKQLTGLSTQVVREVRLDTVFEGQYTAFIGVSATLPFRVFRLSNPARVVVDVRST